MIPRPTIHHYAELMYLLNFEYMFKSALALSSTYPLLHLTSIPEANGLLGHNNSTSTLNNYVVVGLTGKNIICNKKSLTLSLSKDSDGIIHLVLL